MASQSWHTSWKRCCINNKESVKAELLNSYLASLFSMKGNDIKKKSPKKQNLLSHHQVLKLKASMVVGKGIMHICYFKWLKIPRSSQNVSGDGWTKRGSIPTIPPTHLQRLHKMWWATFMMYFERNYLDFISILLTAFLLKTQIQLEMTYLLVLGFVS